MSRAAPSAGRRSSAAALLVLTLALTTVPRTARGHELDSALLSLKEISPDHFSIYWHASSRTLQIDLASAVVFPAPCRLEGMTLACAAPGLVGAFAFPWIEGTLTRVVVDVQWQDGTRLLRVASPTAPRVKVYGGAATGWRALGPVIADYTALGVVHILTGFDHLLFVVALALLVRRGKQLLATVTAFTLAHSLSLAVTVLGLVHVPSAPVEASIALSIVLVCGECLRPADSLTRRAPWAVAFAFGLLHGLGFASALLELGVPAEHVPAALLCFNLGVELGQLAIIVVVVAVRRALALVARLWVTPPWPRRALIYAMGGLAAYWSIDRIGAVFGR